MNPIIKLRQWWAKQKRQAYSPKIKIGYKDREHPEAEKFGDKFNTKTLK